MQWVLLHQVGSHTHNYYTSAILVFEIFMNQVSNQLHLFIPHEKKWELSEKKWFGDLEVDGNSTIYFSVSQNVEEKTFTLAISCCWYYHIEGYMWDNFE